VIPLLTIKDDIAIIAKSDGITTFMQRNKLPYTACDTAAVSVAQNRKNSIINAVFAAFTAFPQSFLIIITP
jgi:hypothetical protein